MALRILGALLILLALVLGLTRAPDRPVESLVARWAPPPSEFVEVQGQAVHLRDVGPRDDPLPVVLLHGTSSSLHTWEGWLSGAHGLSRQRRVLTLDLPGFGLTGPFLASPRYAEGDYRGDTLARFVLDVLDARGIRRFAVGGNSLGGEVAWRVASLAPDRAAALILVDAAGLSFKPQSIPLGFIIARIPVLNRAGEYWLPRELVGASLRNTFGDPSRVTPQLVDRYYELTLREGNRRALGRRFGQLSRGEDAARVDALKLPTLILWGGRDRLIPPQAGREFQRRIAGSVLKVYPELGHVPQEEDPGQTLNDVRAFLGLPP